MMCCTLHILYLDSTCTASPPFACGGLPRTESASERPGFVLGGGHLPVQIFELFVLNVWGAKTFKRSFDHQDVFKP